MVRAQSPLGRRRDNMLSQDCHHVPVYCHYIPMQDPINSSVVMVRSQLPLGHRRGNMSCLRGSHFGGLLS